MKNEYKDKIRSGKTKRPFKIGAYGVSGIGKTTLAANANAIIQPTEEGYQSIDCHRFDKATSFKDVIENIDFLIKEKGAGFSTYALDTLDWLEKLIFKNVCEMKKVNSIDDIGYGKGPKLAMSLWMYFLNSCDKLRDAGVGILFLAHEKIKRFDSPLTDPYDRYQMKLHDLANELIKEYVDALLFANYTVYTTTNDVGFGSGKARGLSSGERMFYTIEQPGFHAKNRFNMPKEIPFTWEAITGFL